MDPVAFCRGFCIKADNAATIAITATTNPTIFTGGRFLLAVPNSSPISKAMGRCGGSGVAGKFSD